MPIPTSSLTHSPAEIIRAVLLQLGLGTDPTPWASGIGNPWPVFASGEPNTPDDCITCYDTVGVDHGQSMVDLELYVHYGVQIRVRSNDHRTGWVKANDVREQASKFGQQSITIDGSVYLVWAVAKMGQVLPIGKETPTSKRSLFTLNCQPAVDQTA